MHHGPVESSSGEGLRQELCPPRLESGYASTVYECVFGGCDGEPEPAAFCTLEDCGTLFQQTSILCSHFFVVVRGCGAF